MKLKALIFLLIFFIAAIYTINPWRLVFINNTLNWIPQLLLTLGIVVPLSFLTLKIKKKALRLITVISLISISVVHFSLVQYFKPPTQIDYLLLYSNPKDEFEKIKIIHNHGFIQSWNKTQHLKTYPNIGIRLEKEFKPTNLNGTWHVHKGNPFHRTEGIFQFKNGIIINN